MIISLQEHRIFFEPSGGDPFRREQLGVHLRLGFSYYAGVGCVGFFIYPKAFKELCGVLFISSRNISVKLGNTTFKFCIYSVYSPTSSSDPVEVVRFYEDIELPGPDSSSLAYYHYG